MPDVLQKTLLILKPDAVQRKLAGKILARLEEKGIQIVAMKMIRIPEALAHQHYGVHSKKPFYPSLIKYITSSPVVVLVARAKNAIEVTRKLMGATFGSRAEPGTIRGDYALSDSFNLIHGSDSPEAAAKEIELYFKPEELLEYAPSDEPWVYDLSEGKPV